MKNLIKQYPTLFGAVLVLGIICAVYLGLGALGFLSTWVIEHFQLGLTTHHGKSSAINLLVNMPVEGLFWLCMAFCAVMFVVLMCVMIFVVSEAIQRSAKSLGAWLSAKVAG
jgi:hypothetical protein